MRGVGAACLTLTWLLAPATVGAAPEETHAVKGDPHGGHLTWATPPPIEQADRDPQIRPATMGAIFVPAMTGGNEEPEFLVLQEGTVVRSQRTGRHAFVPPGTYDVLVGSEVPERRLEFEVVVVEGRTTYVPVEWAGVVINVVDERGTPFRGSYELVQLPRRRYVGLGLGANIAEGERLDTWLLWPGTYMILVAGESYQARRNFATLRLAPGELVEYTLVLNSETEEMLGAGEVSLAPTRASGWSPAVVVGGSLTLNHSDSFIGKSDGLSLGLNLFSESIVSFNDPLHLAYGRLNIEASGNVRFSDGGSRPFVSDVDELSLDLLYMYRIFNWLGPYARFGLETTILPGVREFTEETTVTKLDPQGNLIEFEQNVLDTELAPPLAPLELSFGAGARFDVEAGQALKVATRLGIGGRHVFTRGLYRDDDVEATPELELRRVEDVTQFGGEAALVAEITLTRYVLIKLDTDLLVPFDDPEALVLDFRGTVTLRLSSFASLQYQARVRDDPELSPALQFDQSVLLRFAYKLL